MAADGVLMSGHAAARGPVSRVPLLARGPLTPKERAFAGDPENGEAAWRFVNYWFGRAAIPLRLRFDPHELDSAVGLSLVLAARIAAANGYDRLPHKLLFGVLRRNVGNLWRDRKRWRGRCRLFTDIEDPDPTRGAEEWVGAVADPAEDRDERAELVARATALMAALTPREREVVAARFGIGGAGERRRDDVAENLRVDPKTVGRVWQEALYKMRRAAGVEAEPPISLAGRVAEKRPFTPEEDRVLLAECGRLELAEVARRMGRSYNSVQSRLTKLRRQERRSAALAG